ncbi:probable polyamine oxidase 5 [Cynara cardunculus var. scolymus]|uniref:Amine oxidase n=1 Tax=Cynara cardunculus var. scolymus TaxID=59895 RepID=A0A118K0Q6_CYNCS|nr:probable polyamine oxidase 5 [Cynara cardunculus var. scolymus]KVI01230.1 Amine oxidase [Cynara cardunculus var. scolymus]
MVVKKPRIVIIGAGMAGLTAANKLYKSSGSKGAFEVCVVEGGDRIGGRIKTSEFGGDRIEMGATWIHGIGGSPVHRIAQEINSLESDKPWECMDGFLDDPITIAENGYVLNPSLVDPISNLFKHLMDFAQGKRKSTPFGIVNGGNGIEHGKMSVGSFLRKGLEDYWELESKKEREEVNGNGNGNWNWNRKLLEEAVFAMQENTQRTYTAANDLLNLDYNAESEYIMCPGEEITIAKGYSSVIESLASVLPSGIIQLGKKVRKIEWQPEYEVGITKNGHDGTRPVKLHFLDGTTLSADHIIITVSLGVLKAGIREFNDSGILKFHPPLPDYKIEAISRLGYGVVNKLFLQLSPDSWADFDRFPFLQLVFHQSDSEFKNPKIPDWIRRTASVSPIYKKSRVLLSWFAGEEALKLETLPDEVILDEVSTTLSTFLSNSHDSHQQSNGNMIKNSSKLKLSKVLKSQWGNDPLFMGSYSYIAIGSSGSDIDTLAEPLPKSSDSPQLQILFAGEATHRTHYSTTHGAYFSGLREANRLLEHYHCMD